MFTSIFLDVNCSEAVGRMRVRPCNLASFLAGGNQAQNHEGGPAQGFPSLKNKVCTYITNLHMVTFHSQWSRMFFFIYIKNLIIL